MDKKTSYYGTVLVFCSIAFIGAGCTKTTNSPTAQAPTKPSTTCNPPRNAFPPADRDLAKNPSVIRAQSHLKDFASKIRTTHDISKITLFLAPSSTVAGIGQDIWPQAVASLPSDAVNTYLDSLACELEFAVPVQLDVAQKMILFATQMPLSSDSYSPTQRWFSYDEKNYGFLSPR